MADATMSALALLGKTICADVFCDCDPESGLVQMQARVVGVVVPAPGSKVSLQLLMDEGGVNVEGWSYQLFWDDIRGLRTLENLPLII